MLKTIDIEILTDGKLKIEASGFEDASCLSALKELEKLFGKAENIKMKPNKKHANETKVRS